MPKLTSAQKIQKEIDAINAKIAKKDTEKQAFAQKKDAEKRPLIEERDRLQRAKAVLEQPSQETSS